MKLKLIAAAVALASVAGVNQAEAAIAGGTTGNGSLFLTVWDTSTKTAYVRDLGVSMNNFLPSSVGVLTGDNTLPGTMTPETGVAPMSFATDALFTSTFGGSLASNIMWNISAGDSVGGGGTSGYQRLLTTTTLGTTITAFNNNAMNTSNGNINNWLFNANTNFGCNVSSSCVGAIPGINAYDPSAGVFGTNGTGFGDLGFYYFRGTTNNGTGLAQTTKVAFSNSANFAKWTLGADGSLTYSLAPAVAAVPIPAAAWLFGSGLLGLVGVARRRKA